MKKLVMATQNKNKVREVKQMLTPLGFEIITLDQVNLGHVDVVEDGETFEENAVKKAKEISELCNLPVLADDSGLMVDALNGEPGVYSARYSGPDATYESNNLKLLEALKDVPTAERTARFVCVMAFVDQKNQVEHIVRGEVEGRIEKELIGEGGFGYDPVFFVPELGETFAQASPEDKNRISHRGRALKKMQAILEKIQ